MCTFILFLDRVRQLPHEVTVTNRLGEFTSSFS